MQEIKNASSKDVEEIIELPGHRKKFDLAVKEARGEVRASESHSCLFPKPLRFHLAPPRPTAPHLGPRLPFPHFHYPPTPFLHAQNAGFDRLIFSRPPPSKLRAGQTAPMFQVQANPGADQEVELVVHGGAHVSGTIRRRLLPNGTNPSIAFFDDIVVVPRAFVGGDGRQRERLGRAKRYAASSPRSFAHSRRVPL